MFKKILNFVKLFSLLSSLLIFSFAFLTTSTFAYDQRLRVVIQDPYTCGQNITGQVIGGTGPITVTVEINRDSGNVITYTIEDLQPGGSYTVERPDRDVPAGRYVIVSTAVDALGETDSETFSAEILPPSECSVLETVRTGAANLIRDNLTLTILATIVSSSVVFSLFKKTNKGLKVSR